MSSAQKAPRLYVAGLRARLAEGRKYRGGSGQLSWLLHRVTGLGILLFLIIHIVDTFLVVAYPAIYDHTVGIYGGMVTGLPWDGLNGYYWILRWGFRLGELGLIACVLFHALNGLRIVAYDFAPSLMEHQAAIFRWVLIAFAIIMLIVAVFVIVPLTKSPNHWKMPEPAPAASLVESPSSAKEIR